jgi:hypothetical protein
MLEPSRMSAASDGGLRLIPSNDSGAEPQPSSGSLARFAAIVILAALFALGLHAVFADRRALESVPAPQRAELLSRTVAELRDFCGTRASAALKDHCRELASFASGFDACQGECEELVRRELAPRPTR